MTFPELDRMRRFVDRGAWRPVTRCVGQWQSWACPVCNAPNDARTHVTLWSGCGTRGCVEPGCRRHVARERSRGITRAFDLVGGDPSLSILVFPAPPELREVLESPDELRRWTKGTWTILERWMLARYRLDPNRYRVGSVCILHPSGDEPVNAWQSPGTEDQGNPLDEWTPAREHVIQPEEYHPHLNFLVPLVAVRAGLDDAGKVRFDGVDLLPGTGWISPEDLADLKRDYSAFVARTWGIPERPGGFVLNASFASYKSPKKRAHAIRYFARGFPRWTRAYQAQTWHGVFSLGNRKRLKSVAVAPRPKIAENPECRCRYCGYWWSNEAIGPRERSWILLGYRRKPPNERTIENEWREFCKAIEAGAAPGAW